MYKWVCDSLNSAITQFGSSNYPDGSPSGARVLAAFFDSEPYINCTVSNIKEEEEIKNSFIIRLHD